MRKHRTRAAFAGMLATTAVLATACPPPASTTPVNWSFKATQVTVDDSQDAVYDPFFGWCISLDSCSDEPYVLNINFRVKIGVPGSAQTFVTGSRNDAQPSMDAGITNAVSGAAQATAGFDNVVALDVLDLTDANNHLEVLGSYTWAMERDLLGVDLAAGGTASVLKDALNATLAAGALPSDPAQIINIIVASIGNAVGILAQNIPTFGLGDEAIGGGMYIGLAVKGALADVVNGTIASTPFPSIAIPLVDLPPDITQGGFYTTTATKDFNRQTWSCCDGQHTWNLQAGPA